MANLFDSLFTDWTWPLPGHVFGVLACLPGFIAMFNWIAEKVRFNRTRKEIQQAAGNSASPRPLPKFEKSLEEYGPRWWYLAFGVTALTVVFAIVAILGGREELLQTDLGIGVFRDSKVTRAPEVVNGLAGLVYAGYGAYIYTLLLMISRLNSAALTGKFLAVSAVRSAIALVLGFVAADTNIFSGLSTNQGLFVLFFIGLFPSWAMDALRQRAQAVFKPAGPACDTLPLCMIDGLDDGIADRLAETGIWDIVHIATSDPFDLAAKTLYPLRRILDWMDQAILISYVRGQIIHFRACGLRGAIDFAALYIDAMNLSGDRKNLSPAAQENLPVVKKRAEELMKILAQKTNLPEQALYTIGRNVSEDSVVNFIWAIWFDDSNNGDVVHDNVDTARPPGQ